MFEPDSIVCVIEGPLRLRSKPSTAANSEKFDPLLQTGQLLFIIDGPEADSGYGWYLVHEVPGWYMGAANGWVAAAARDGTPWLATATVTCPADPSLEDLTAMDAMLRLHCYHDREFTFTGTVTPDAMCGDGGVLKRPTWMAGCLTTFSWGRPQSDLVVAISPDLASELGDVEYDVTFPATITAHMDDPAAQGCVPFEGIEGDYELLNPGVVLGCRSLFVATSFKRVAP